MADPRVYSFVALAIITYLIFGSSSVKKDKFVPPPNDQPGLTPEAKQMDVMRFAMENDEPMYRMSRKEIQHRLKSYSGS